MSSRVERLLESLINGETPASEPLSDLELYLMNCINGIGTESLPEPDSRLELLLYRLAEKMAGSIIATPTSLVDQTTGNVYDLYANNGDLKMGVSSNSDGASDVTLIDRTTGISYKLYVDNGNLSMKESG